MLKAPPPPLAHVYLIGFLNIISRGRHRDETGWLPIPLTEYDAFARLMGIRLRPWELNALLRLDNVWREVMAEDGHSFEDKADDDKEGIGPA